MYGNLLLIEIELTHIIPVLTSLVLSVNSMDKMGNYNFDISNEFYMTRLGQDGLPIAGTDVIIQGTK
jgi:hypothetical protein